MTRRIMFILAAFWVAGSARAENVSHVKVEALTCEHLTNPMGIGNAQPRFSWKLRSDRAGEVQTAWEIRAASSMAGLKASSPDLWNSGKIVSDQSVLVPWAGKPLGSRAQVFWQARVWDKDGQPTAWSDPASFELGLLDSASEWKGKWITADLPRDDIEKAPLEKASWIGAGASANQATGVRLLVDLPANAVVRSAVVDAVADGAVTLYVNGHANRNGSTSLTAPMHATVLDQLVPGKNAFAIGSAAVRNAGRRGGSDAGRNAIAAQVLIEFENGKRLELNTDGAWKSAVTTGTNWAGPTFDDSAWAEAKVIAPYSAQPSRYSNLTIGPGRYLRKNFGASRPIAKARLYATALGVYEASINGQRVTQDLLTPGWTDYTKRVMVQTYDVTKLIRRGQNAIGVALGDGWYAGRLGWMGLSQYGTRPVFNGQLEITYADGSTDVLASNSSWKAGTGEIVGSDQQWGEDDDARGAAKNWDQAGFDDAGWTNAVVEQHSVKLVSQLGPPVRALMELKPLKIVQHGGAWIVDFGQNLVGHVRLSARGKAGDTITVRHAEITNSDGLLYTENLRTALATDRFTLAGTGRETLEPHFTFHGFRYVEVTGYPGKLSADDLHAIVVGSDDPPTGTFECSNPDLNRLYQNIVWSQRGNFLSVPTDCPQRDERMGWMGDAQVFAATAARNADVAAFFAKWMVDVNDGQGSNGDYSDVSPRVARPQAAMPIWGDAGVIIPWEMYQTYGDKSFLADNYEHMARWVDFNEKRSHMARANAPATAGPATRAVFSVGPLILTGGVGDHLAFTPTPTEIPDTAYFANSARIVAKSAELLGKTEDAAKYNKLCHDITEAFDEKFVSTNGVIQADTQTGYVVALKFGMLPDEVRAAAAQRLADNVARSGHVTGGFVGNGLICPVLSGIGRSDLAWEMVLTDTYPSWLFSVKNGATTIWERWDGWTPEKGFQDSSMNSFNHYSLGSVGEWLYSGAAGIQADEASPGYKHFVVAPQFTTRLSRLKATFDSPYGVISSGWRTEKGDVLYDLTIPPNSSATLMLPFPVSEVRQFGQPIRSSDNSTTKLALAAGTYHFSLPKRLVQ